MRSDQVMKKANQRKPIPICRKGRKKDPSIPSIGHHENTLFVRFVESPSIIASRAPSTRAARKSRSVAANDVSAVLVPVKLHQGPGRWDQRPRKSGPGKSEAQPQGKQRQNRQGSHAWALQGRCHRNHQKTLDSSGDGGGVQSGLRLANQWPLRSSRAATSDVMAMQSTAHHQNGTATKLGMVLHASQIWCCENLLGEEVLLVAQNVDQIGNLHCC